MATIDAHQHFWLFDPVRDAWINDDMRTIQRNFLPADLLPVLKDNGIDGTIAVQANQSETENEFLLLLGEKDRAHMLLPDFKRGISTLEKFSALPYVYCKVSGIITEADWRNWAPRDINPYLDVVVAGNYERMKNLTDQYFESFSADEKVLIFGANAERFYQLQ
jgi:predicted TIM-barrel fold metal-dependent hydrolase